MIFAEEYEILREVEASGLKKISLLREPVRVATLLNEEAFKRMGGAMIHHQTVFFEDRTHDWDWRDSEFRYYTRVDDKADVLVVYKERHTP